MAFEDIGSMSEPPRLSKDNFSIWKHRMIAFMNFLDINLLQTIMEGPPYPLLERSLWSDEDKRKVALEYKAKHILTTSLPNDIFSFVMYCESAKDMWDNLIALFEGTDDTREYHRGFLIQQFELFTYKPGESLAQTYIRFNCLINDLKQHNKTFRNEDMLIKFLKSLPPAFNTMAMVIRLSGNLETRSLQSVYGKLLTHELETKHDAWKTKAKMDKRAENSSLMEVWSSGDDDEHEHEHEETVYCLTPFEL